MSASTPHKAWSACRSSTRERKPTTPRSEEHTSELQSRVDLVCRLLLEKKKKKKQKTRKSKNKRNKRKEQKNKRVKNDKHISSNIGHTTQQYKTITNHIHYNNYDDGSR